MGMRSYTIKRISFGSDRNGNDSDVVIVALFEEARPMPGRTARGPAGAHDGVVEEMVAQVVVMARKRSTIKFISSASLSVLATNKRYFAGTRSTVPTYAS